LANYKHAEGIDPHSPEEYKGYVGLKLNTQELLNRFRKCADGCPLFIANRIRAISDELVRGIEVRNLATHGAFFWEDENQGTIGAAHYFARGRGKARELFEVKQTIRRETVEEILQIANRILHELIDLRTMVIDWRYPNGLPEPSDLTALDFSGTDK
jgi:hypothetical protein